MYVCQVCRSIVGPGLSRLLHLIRYASGSNKGQIAQEIPVCPACKTELDNGTLLVTLLRKAQAAEQVRQKEQPPAVTVKPKLDGSQQPIRLNGVGLLAPGRHQLRVADQERSGVNPHNNESKEST